MTREQRGEGKKQVEVNVEEARKLIRARGHGERISAKQDGGTAGMLSRVAVM